MGLALRQNLRDNWLGAYFPSKPTTLHFLANDVCGSEYCLCQAWPGKQETEVASQQLHRILADPLFDAIQGVELTVGESGWRADLPEICRILIKSLPEIRSLQLITNVLNAGQVIEQTSAFAEAAQLNNIAFSVMFSVDRIRDVQDHILSPTGELAAVIQVIKSLKQNGIPVSASCTLTPTNCSEADDVLLWCEQNGVRECNFHLGVDASQFNNQSYSQQNLLTPEQRFHLIMFFDKLARRSSIKLEQRLFYKSLVDQQAFDRPRKAGCRWQKQAVTLDIQGNLRYCPPHSPILGSALQKSGWHVFRDGLPIRQHIHQQECPNCVQGSPGTLSTQDLIRRGASVIQTQYQQYRDRRLSQSIGFPRSIQPADCNAPADWKHVLITGWYGTETTGDKAILGEVLHFIKTYSPECKITLTTINQKVSDQTQLELCDLQNVSQVCIGHGHSPELIESVDAVIIGGGPLMEVGQMEAIWRIFIEANRQHKARIVFGCGIGPLYSDRMLAITKDILKLSTAGFLRDEESHVWADKLAPGHSLDFACDPAFAYLHRWVNHSHINNAVGNGSQQIIGLLRANPKEFVFGQLDTLNRNTAQKLAQIMELACINSQTSTNLLAMNSHWLGGDDRIFNRQIAGFFDNPELVRVERNYLSTEGMLHSIQSAKAAIAMRYHGHIFCMAVGIPFLSIDYTGKNGKVQNLMRRSGYENWSENLHAIDVARAAQRLQILLAERKQWSAHLRGQTDLLVDELYRTYSRVFNVAPPENLSIGPI